MNAPASFDDVPTLLSTMGQDAKSAARALAASDAPTRTRALEAAAQAIRDNVEAILRANQADMEAATHLSASMRDRLALDARRIAGIAQGVDDIAAIPDPVGEIVKDWTRPNGLHFQRVRVPIGVIGIIYESRPNVTADAAALCLRSGNAAILRGGSESLHSSRALHGAMVKGMVEAGLPATAIQLVPTADRAAVGAMLSGLDGAIDLIIPRGGKGLVGRVQSDARVPVLSHLEGLCHTYVHAAANAEKARSVVLNAKMRRTSVCGATETVLIDRAVLNDLGRAIVEDLLAAGCAIRGDRAIQALNDRVTPAAEDDWRTEYGDAIVNVKAVGGIEEAIAHIARYSTQHTDAILTEDEGAANRFFQAVDSAIVLWNASTQFADGGEFGFGAEIGIATGKLHARGPVGAAELTTYKTIVRGTGQTRP